MEECGKNKKILLWEVNWFRNDKDVLEGIYFLFFFYSVVVAQAQSFNKFLWSFYLMSLMFNVNYIDTWCFEKSGKKLITSSGAKCKPHYIINSIFQNKNIINCSHECMCVFVYVVLSNFRICFTSTFKL